MSKYLTKNYFYKDRKPEETILLIRQILHKAKIVVIERYWFDGFDSFYSCRLEIQDAHIGVNGKGSTIIYALASAYGELMERLQTHMLFMNTNLSFAKEKYGFQIDPKEKHIRKKELPLLPDSFKNSFMFVDKYSTYDYWRDTFLQEDGPAQVVFLPFEDIIKETEIFLPADIVYMLSGSNGMCAGNTKFEALSQGLSEIFERYVMKKIYMDCEVIGSVPEYHLKEYFPEEYNLMQKVQENSNFIFEVKDCTFGGKFPVMALVVRDLENNSYTVCFGADPDIRIALQRCITEIFQGTLTLFEKSHPFELVLPSEISYVEYNEQLKSSSGMWAYTIFQNKKDSFPIPDTFCSSEEKYYRLINMFKQSGGKHIYIRDCSYADIQVYQIIIPGFSEAFIHCEERKKFRQRMVLVDILSKEMSIDEINRVCLELKISNQLEYGNQLYWLSYCKLNIGSVQYPMSWQYLIFALLLKGNQLEQAGKWLKEYNKYIKDSCHILLQLYNYISLRIQGIENSQVFTGLEKIYGLSTVDKMKQIIKNPISFIEIDYESIRKEERAVADVYLKVKQMQLEYYKGER